VARIFKSERLLRGTASRFDKRLLGRRGACFPKRRHEFGVLVLAEVLRVLLFDFMRFVHELAQVVQLDGVAVEGNLYAPENNIVALQPGLKTLGPLIIEAVGQKQYLAFSVQPSHCSSPLSEYLLHDSQPV